MSIYSKLCVPRRAPGNAGERTQASKSPGWMVPMSCLAALLCSCATSAPAFAWGDAGHQIVAAIADHYLEPAVRRRIAAILTTDRSRLTAGTDIASEATWADKYRDSDRATTQLRYHATRNWHFVDLELERPDLETACFGQPPFTPGKLASRGPAADCLVDKIDEFVAELRAKGTSRKERLLALQFVLHLVGDLHQPLHTSDDHDEGGNEKTLSAPGLAAASLHSDWDTAFVLLLGDSPAQIADQLSAQIAPARRASWSSGTTADWALESFAVARDHAYGTLPAPSSGHHYEASAAYVGDAKRVVAEQLSKAGVRLAYVLNGALR